MVESSCHYADPSEFDKENDIKIDKPQSIIHDEKQQQQQQHKLDLEKPDLCQRCWCQLVEIYNNDSLLIEVMLAIFLAYLYPPLGGLYLCPEYTAHWGAVIAIFFLSGFCLRISELMKAAHNVKFNIFVQSYNFLFTSIFVNLVSRYLYMAELLSDDLLRGMVICSCLPMTVNMCLVLTAASHGDEAAALFNATFGNLTGVFLTPVLILLYMGQDSHINFVDTYVKICLRVLLPIALGVGMRCFLKDAEQFAEAKRNTFKLIRERCMVFVVYATFCHTFMSPPETSWEQLLIMAVTQILILITTMVLSWILLWSIFQKEAKLRVMGLFGCTHKTVALGIPLINAIYEDSASLGIYTLPLLVWYTTQFLVGTSLAPRLARFVEYKAQNTSMPYNRRRSSILNMNVSQYLEDHDLI